MSEGPSIVWFRHDLRLADHPALRAAIDRGWPTVCLHILDPDGEGDWPLGGASRWWLHHSLASLDADLSRMGQRLVHRAGPAEEVLRGLVREHAVGAVFWNRRYEPAVIARDTRIKSSLREAGVHAESFRGSVLFDPASHQTQSGDPYRVFTPFWNQVIRRDDPPPPLARPRKMPPPPSPVVPGMELEELGLLPTIPWDRGLQDAWTPGEKEAHALLSAFGERDVGAYNDRRNFPAVQGTSRLSPHLHFGEISPVEVWHGIRETQRSLRGKSQDSATGYLRQIVWREFAHHLLFHYPRTPSEPLREAFTAFPWRKSAKDLRAWQRGRTGYPIVDAGMRELWHIGWMHNRVRMVVGSFLVKHLLLHWRHGAAWFWDTLVDADLANNTLGWQWISGCGADAAPYFRVFNPMMQGLKFDAEGEYVRQWVPELAQLPDEHLHTPWEAPSDVLKRAGVSLGKTYPLPIVDHKAARDRALQAYEVVKARTASLAISSPKS